MTEFDSTIDYKLAVCEIDNGRFQNVIHAFKMNDSCHKCGYLRPNGEMYRCAVIGGCPGVTLSQRTKDYIERKIKND